MNIEEIAVVSDGKSWEKDIPELGDIELLVGPWENPAFEREMQKGIKALPPALRPDGQVEPAAYYRVLGRVMARTILFDWKNFQLGGTDKPFDQAYAETILTDRKYRTFRDGVVAAAKRVQTGLAADTQAMVGNSPASSSGSATGAAASSS